MNTCHKMIIIVQTTSGYKCSLNSEIDSPNKTHVNIKRDLLLDLSHNTEKICFAYQYAILLLRQTENRLCGDVPYFLCHGRRPSYKHIKLWRVRVYIINGCVTRNILDDRPHRDYFMGYEATTGVILYWKPY